MIIPIGHEEDTVRRLPWVTFVVIALNIVVFLSVGLQAERTERRIGDRFRAVVDYWGAHPYLDLPDDFLAETATARERRDVTLMSEAMKGAGHDTEVYQERAREQEELDRLVARFWDARGSHPYWRWGFTPAHPSVDSLLASMFMHAGWLHLITNMFILFLAGPAVEDRYGRPLFAALYLSSGVVAALAQMAAAPASTVPLVGASGAIAGVMGAFLIRLGRTRIRFFYWFAFVFRGTFTAPAWTMLSLWLLQQLFYGSLVGAEGGVAYWAHAGGFAYGVAVAVFVRQLRIEERFVHPAIEASISVVQHPGLEEGLVLLSRGEVESARRHLEQVVADEPGNVDARLGLWQSYLEEGRAGEGTNHLLAVVETEVRGGEPVLAYEHWCELQDAGGSPGPAALRYRLGSMLQDQDRDGAVRIFETIAADADSGLLQDKASRRLAELGAVAGPVPEAAPEADGRRAAAAVAAAVVAELRGAPEDGAAPVAAADGAVRARIEEVVPQHLQPEGLMVRASDGDLDLVPCGEIEAVAVAGVRSTNRAVLVVDVVRRARVEDAPTVLRMVSSAFDPRQVVGDSGAAPMAAMRRLVAALVDGSQARLLSGRELLDGGNPVIYATLAEFGAAVYPAHFTLVTGDDDRSA